MGLIIAVLGVVLDTLAVHRHYHVAPIFALERAHLPVAEVHGKVFLFHLGTVIFLPRERQLRATPVINPRLSLALKLTQLNFIARSANPLNNDVFAISLLNNLNAECARFIGLSTKTYGKFIARHPNLQIPAIYIADLQLCQISRFTLRRKQEKS